MSEFLSNLSAAMASSVEAGGRGVVRVEGRRRLAASGAIWASEGVILTAHHVVHGDEEIGIGLPDGSQTSAVVFPPAGVNLSAEGASDWMHWGLGTNTSVNRKAGVPPRIGDFTVTGANVVRYAEHTVIVHQYALPRG